MRKVAFMSLVLLFCAVTGWAEDGELTVAKQMIDQANAQFAASGSSVRIVKASFFMRGHGAPDYRHLRTGSKWPYRGLTYIVDGSDMSTDVSAAGAAATIVNAYNTWNAVPNTNITASQIADDGSNFDVLDGTFHPVTGACLSIFDLTSPNLDLSSGQIFPAADIVVGGWLKPQYFASCLGSSSILGVTWTFSDGDANSDHYVDNLYVEQYYNEGFSWVLNGSTFLGLTEDIETVVLHENGHALGLDHMGGPNPNQPFKLQPNGKVFDPEAVMNPYYLGGEKRSLFPTDLAGLRTLYSNPH
ncbi:MAG TPA: hypothetical protein VEK11_09015 [Thermoanaerobaculia bacterium]|nr:hypothetical protein [Thermoanaerobaculia bacterium]